MGFNIGDTVGDYQIIGALGAGGMGKVYKVRNIIADRVEAMKVLLPDLANEPELADRFMREIKLLGSLDHPNIAALRTAMRVDNQLLMIMEFVEGTGLDARVQQGPIPVKEALSYVIQMLSALSYAHERGIIHRDIKPANMMVTPNGTLKLMDFGIAKAAADRRLTMTGTTMGSLYYMSPEQVKGSTTIDGRADLYSVGVALYELVTATRPFRGDSDYAIMVAHLEKAPVAPIEVDPKLPPLLNDIILTAIQKDPAKRFQTAKALAAALGNVLNSLGGEQPAPAAAKPVPQQAAPPPRPAAAVPVASAAPAPVPAGPPKSRRGLWMAAGAVLVLAVIAGAAIQLPKWYKTGAASEPAPAPQAAVTPVEPVQAAPSPAAPAPAEPAPATAAQAQPSNTPATQTAPAAVSQPDAVVPSRSAARSRTPSSPAGAPAQQARSTPSAPASAPAAQARTPEPAQPAQPAPQPVPQPAVQASGASEAELEPIRDRLDQVSARAGEINRSLQGIEASQRYQGTGGLNARFTTPMNEMQRLLGRAKEAFAKGDAAGAKRNLDAAEKHADTLDRLLNRH